MILGTIKRFPRFSNRNLISILKKDSKESGVEAIGYEKCPHLNTFKEGKYLPDSWIGCRFAFPHTDSLFGQVKFLTLVVKGNNFIFGSESNASGIAVPVGTLFMVDPMKYHWLHERDWNIRKFFVAVQWEIGNDEFEDTAEKIMKDLVRFERA